MVAGIKRMRQLRKLAEEVSGHSEGNGTLIPSFGIGSFGHMWNLVITAKLENGDGTCGHRNPGELSICSNEQSHDDLSRSELGRGYGIHWKSTTSHWTS